MKTVPVTAYVTREYCIDVTVPDGTTDDVIIAEAKRLFLEEDGLDIINIAPDEYVMPEDIDIVNIDWDAAWEED